MGRGGYRIIGLVALCAAGFGCAVQKPQEVEPKVEQAVAIPADLQNAVRDAELWGRALYERYTSPTVDDDPAVKTAIETVRESVKDTCAGSYRAIAVRPAAASDDRIIVYYVGEIPKSQGLMVGRHYHVETTADGKGVLMGEPSTSRCIVLPPAGPDSTAMRMITHNLSPTPNEFHVFLSMIDGHALRVVTEQGRWRVEQGRISYLGRT
jgi:hypothetical protein